MNVNIVVYPPRYRNNAPSMARIFLSECDKTEPVRLAEKLLSNDLKVGQATWDFYSDSGIVDVVDIYYRQDDALKNFVYNKIEEIYNIKPIISDYN